MKKNDSKISITSTDHLLKAVDHDSVPAHIEIDGERIDFEVKRLLDFSTLYNLVHEVANASFVMDEQTGEEHYDAVHQTYMTHVVMLTAVANFKPETASNKLYKLMHDTDALDCIRSIWSTSQYNEFLHAVEQQVEFKQRELLAAERRQLQKAIDQIDKANTVFAQFVTLFENIDPAQFMAELKKISDMSEEQIGTAVVRARDRDFVEQRKAELQH